MTEEKSKAELVNLILEDENGKALEEEEMLHLLLQRKVSKNINRMQGERLTLGAKMADNIAKFAGSWTFIIIFISCLVLWIVLNALILTRAYDPYPFILLNLILSCVAAIQAPVIMMSQNRQEEKDRLRSLNDYKTNLKSEIIVEDLHQKLDELLKNQRRIFEQIEKLEKMQSKK
jgi:Predicted membrane protein